MLAGNGKSVLETRTDSAEMPALKALLFRGGVSNTGVLACEICELGEMLSKIAAAIGMLPDLKFDTESRLFTFLLSFSFFFPRQISERHLNKSYWLLWKSCLLKVIVESPYSNGQADGVSVVSLSSSVPKQP